MTGIHTLTRWRHWRLAAYIIAITLARLVPSLGRAYTRTIYPAIASVIAPISSAIPLPIGDIFITASIGWIIVYPIYSICHKKQSKRKTIARVAEYLAWVYVWFYVAWGLNYSQPDIYQRMNMQPAEVSADNFRSFAYRYADSLNAEYERERIKGEKSMFGMEVKRAGKAFKADVQNLIFKGYDDMEHDAEEMGINHTLCRRPPAKTMLFSSLSSMAGVTGSMAPFFSEFTLNADLQPHEYPATYAHEYAHFLGIANEGEANFYSYVACTASADSGIRFSGYYHILFHVLGNMRKLLGEQEYAAYLNRINPEIIRLARHDRQYWLSRRSTVLDSAQDFVYNIYLRGNRVEGGMKSYSGVIGMLMAWEEKKK